MEVSLCFLSSRNRIFICVVDAFCCLCDSTRVCRGLISGSTRLSRQRISMKLDTVQAWANVPIVSKIIGSWCEWRRDLKSVQLLVPAAAVALSLVLCPLAGATCCHWMLFQPVAGLHTVACTQWHFAALKRACLWRHKWWRDCLLTQRSYRYFSVRFLGLWLVYQYRYANHYLLEHSVSNKK